MLQGSWHTNNYELYMLQKIMFYIFIYLINIQTTQNSGQLTIMKNNHERKKNSQAA